jgi:hypothetical protein
VLSRSIFRAATMTGADDLADVGDGEAPLVLGRGAVHSYLIGAPPVIAASWASELARRTPDRRTTRPSR